MNERQVPADETQETKLSKEKEELIMKYVSVLQRKWEEESNNESTSDA